MKLKNCILGIILYLILGTPVFPADENPLKITGCVEQPLSLTLKDMEKFEQSEIQFTDVLNNGEFRGVFACRGVSLKTLLTLSGIKKTEPDFNKPVDLAVVVKNTQKDKAILSWGEIFFKNPDRVLVVLSATPVFPHKGIDHFKDKAAYERMIQTLNRSLVFPRLVVSGDLFSDRCIESVSEIRVVDLKPKVDGQKSPSVSSEQFKIIGPGISPLVTTELPEFPGRHIRAHVVGEGRGYHGTHTFEGISLTDLLNSSKARFDINSVFMISAPDAYRSLISYGELFLNPHGNRILITDKVDEKEWKNGGRFILVLPDDLMADREVKAVSRIEIISIPE